MKIATWNLDRRNDNALDGVKTLIAEHEVLCLQEVHEDILDDVTALTEHHFIADECTYRGGQTFIVILSKHPIHNAECIDHKHWRSLRNWWRNQKEGRCFQRVDIDRDGQQWRVINAHLPLNVSPFCRMCEWARIWNETDEDHNRNVICGDFNTFAGPIWALFFGVFMGFRLKDLFLNERNLMQKYIERSDFTNPFRKKKFTHTRTHMHVPYQLDFLLHHEKHKTKDAKRWPKRMGSDHWPLSAQIELQD